VIEETQGLPQSEETALVLDSTLQFLPRPSDTC